MKWVNCLLQILFWTKFGYKIGYSLSLQLHLKKLTLLYILKIYPLDCMFFILLTYISNFVPIICYSLYDP